MTERTFDWHPARDDRSLAFPAHNLLRNMALRPKLWRTVPRLDQGSEGACVGFGWSHTLGSAQRAQEVTNESARELYHLAQTLDDRAGTNYSGTSVLAGAKAAKQLGRITSYHWCNTLQDVLDVLAWKGPVTLGVWWYEGMVEPDTNDRIHVTGDVVGGHCVSIHEVRTAARTVRIRNSWGEEWGRRGDCFLSWDNLRLLLSQDGEACVGVKP